MLLVPHIWNLVLIAWLPEDTVFACRKLNQNSYPYLMPLSRALLEAWQGALKHVCVVLCMRRLMTCCIIGCGSAPSCLLRLANESRNGSCVARMLRNGVFGILGLFHMTGHVTDLLMMSGWNAQEFFLLSGQSNYQQEPFWPLTVVEDLSAMTREREGVQGLLLQSLSVTVSMLCWAALSSACLVRGIHKQCPELKRRHCRSVWRLLMLKVYCMLLLMPVMW